MFCPNCGLENAKGQKFCRRCGANLMAFDLAQNFINEVATGNSANQAEPNSILKITALISILGFLFITIGVILVTLMQHEYHQGGPPMGLFLAIFGYSAIVLICRRLLKLLEIPRTEAKPFVVQHALEAPAPAQPYFPPTLPSQTNRNLGAAPVYHSITEQETQQFEHELRANS
jgi:hypothetical protein